MKEYSFENFSVNKENRYAFKVAEGIANNPGAMRSIVTLYGEPGTGKTHLLFAIENKILENNPSAKVLYTDADELTKELITAIQNNQMREFHSLYREIDVLLIDNLENLIGKNETQREVLSIARYFEMEEKQLVVAISTLKSSPYQRSSYCFGDKDGPLFYWLNAKMRVFTNLDKYKDSVFAFGTKSVNSLPDSFIKALHIETRYVKPLVLVGDCDGVDLAIQKHLKFINYPYVIVYCSGDAPRHNEGNWPVEVRRAKDKAMIEDCGEGLCLWDGRSKGTLQNIKVLRSAQCNKNLSLYFDEG